MTASTSTQPAPLRRGTDHGIRRVLRLTLFALLGLAGCTDLLLDTERVPTRLRLDATTVTTVEGDTIAVQVTVLDQEGVAYAGIPGWSPPSWSSSSDSIIGIVGRRLVARRPGEARAMVELAGLADSLTLRVNPSALALRIEGVYLIQSVQRFDGSVPLVAGRDALLRVFLRGDQINFFKPAVRVKLYHGGELAQTLTVPAAAAVPTAVREGQLEGSWNVWIPGRLVRPGLSILVEADPSHTIPLKPQSRTRFPASGEPLPIAVQDPPTFALRLVPIYQTAYGTTGNVSVSNHAKYLAPVLAMFPISAYDVDLRVPYATDARAVDGAGWNTILREIAALRIADGSSRYYYGVLRREGGWAGLGYIGWPAAIGYDAMPDAAITLAHELGHNFGRRHAPCGHPSNPDPDYPYADARIGVFGFNRISGRLVQPGDVVDLMSYCAPRWISDYTFAGILEYRTTFEPLLTAAEAEEPSLLVWGSIGGGRAVLEPSFEIVTRPSLPTGPGPYTLEGLDPVGAPLFSISFAGREVAHAGSSERQFAFALPRRLARTDRLAALRLSGNGAEATLRAAAPISPGASGPGRLPGRVPSFTVQQPRHGEVALRWEAARHPMVMVRDPQTGTILSFARGGAVRVRTDATALDLLFSDGIHTTVRRAPVR